MLRIRFVVGLIALAILMPSDALHVEAAPPVPTTQQEVCHLLSPQVASKVLKGTAEPDQVQPFQKNACNWSVPSFGLKSRIVYFQVANNPLSGGCPRDQRAVKGVGDAACWAEQSSAMQAWRHNVSVEVWIKTSDGSPSGDLDSVSAVARDILGHF